MGSGKTTLARRLEHKLPGLRLTIDEWIVALYGPDLNAGEFPVASRRVAAVLEGGGNAPSPWVFTSSSTTASERAGGVTPCALRPPRSACR